MVDGDFLDSIIDPVNITLVWCMPQAWAIPRRGVLLLAGSVVLGCIIEAHPDS